MAGKIVVLTLQTHDPLADKNSGTGIAMWLLDEPSFRRGAKTGFLAGLGIIAAVYLGIAVLTATNHNGTCLGLFGSSSCSTIEAVFQAVSLYLLLGVWGYWWAFLLLLVVMPAVSGYLTWYFAKE